MLKQIGKSLQQARTARGLTQAELGALVGLPQSHISKIERGGTDFQWTTLEQIANAVGLSPVLVPTGMVPLVESLVNGRGGKGEEEPVPLVGSLTETEE
jgi:transcriptional regulator with XRE-family HTH domain